MKKVLKAISAMGLGFILGGMLSLGFLEAMEAITYEEMWGQLIYCIIAFVVLLVPHCKELWEEFKSLM